MTNVIELAKEAGLLADDGEVWLSPYQEAMERFAALVRAEVETEWIETNKALAKEIIVKNEALKLAEEALQRLKRSHYYCEDTWYSCPKAEEGCANDAEGNDCNCGADVCNADADKALAAIREALAESVKQEPVAWMQIGVGSNKGTTMFVTRLPNWHREDEWQFEPLYTSPIQPVNQEPVQKPAAWFHKIGCRANAFGECDMGCQPPVDAKSIREAARAELMAELNKTWGNKHWTAYEEAIREEALEEAAKMCEEHARGFNEETDNARLWCAAAIRGLK